MLEFFRNLFGTDFMPHVYCLRDPTLVAVHAVSDILIAIAYFLIPLALLRLLHGRRDLAFPWMFSLFGVFILACGTTHVLAVWTLWHPIYRFEALIKIITALASIPTAILLFRIMPRIIALPSPVQLNREIGVRRTVEESLRKLNLELEDRVRERTDKLEQTNEKLRRSELQYRTLVEAMPQLVWTAGRDGQCEYLSRQWLEYTGRTEEEQLGYGWLECLHPNDRTATGSAWIKAIEEGQPYDVEFRIRSQNGAYRWFKTRGVPLKNDAGETLRWLGTCTDIDTEKQSAITLEKHNQHLEDLAFATAHHLQEPVRLILLQTQQLVRRSNGFLDENSQRIVRSLRGNAERLERLLRDVLVYTEANTRNVALEAVNVAQILKSALKRCQPSIDEAGAIVTCTGSLPCVNGNAKQLQEVFEHLIGNAVKYRDSQRPARIIISAIQTGTEAIFSVCDNGIGIDPVFREKVFGLFKRLHTEEEYPGTGIGLALCQRIIESHGGRLWLEPAEGAGSVFRFSLRIEDVSIGRESLGSFARGR